VDGKEYENEAFQDDSVTMNDAISLPEFPSNTKSKTSDDCCVFKFHQRFVDGKRLIRLCVVWAGPV